MRAHRKIHLQTKLLLGLVVMATALTAILATAVSHVYRIRMEEQYSELAFAQAAIAADMIDGDRIAGYLDTGEKDEYYEQIRQYLQDTREKMNLRYFYVVVPEEDVMVYVWDTGSAGDEGVCDLGDTDAYYGGGRELMHEAFSADAQRSILITDNDEYGYLASAYVAILDSSGTPQALASVDVSMDMINSQIGQFISMTIRIALIVLIISVVAYSFYVRKILIQPLGQLHHAAVELVESRMEKLHSFRLELHTGDELQELAESYRYMVSELCEYIRDLKLVTAEKERIGAELDVAHRIQASMLPCIFPPFPEREEFDVYASMTPAKEVGGDFYDFFIVDDDHLALVMADVSGKGVPAALFMMIAKTLIKSAVLSGLSPRAVLEKVNNQLCEHNDAEMFVTVWLGVMEISTGRMTCANAGHEYPAVMRRDGCFELLRDRHGFVLAGMENARYREYELTLNAGDRLFVYTDGVPEAMNSDGAFFGNDRLLEALNRGKDGDCREILEGVRESVKSFTDGAEPFDDITMLCLEMRGTARDMKKMSVAPVTESIPAVIAFFEEALTAAGAPKKVIAQVSVAADEVFSNIAHYSGATLVTLGCRVSGDRVTLRFSDNGRPYDPTGKADPDTTLSAQERDIGGLGIYIVKKTMDGMQYGYRDGLNILTVVKKL